MRWFFCLIALSLLLVPSICEFADGAGRGQQYTIHLERVEYTPGDTVVIKVEGPTNGTALILIMDGMESIFSPIEGMFDGIKEKYQDIVLYEERKQMINGWTEIRYTIPEDDSRYRYLVFADGDIAFFFAKEKANKIVTSDIRLINPEVKPGESVNFELKVTDGVGNSIPHVRISTAIPYQSCEGQDSLSSDESPISANDIERNQYAINGIIRGSIPIPVDFEPGKYNLNIWTSGETKIGFTPTEDSVKFDVLDVDERIITNLFDQLSFDNGRKSIDSRVGQSLHLSGRTVLNHCVLTLSNIPLKVELIEWSLHGNVAVKTVETKTFHSGEDGSFIIPLNLTGLNPGGYMAEITAEFQGFIDARQFDIRLHNIKDYLISAEEKEFKISVDAWYSNSTNLQFNQNEKKIVLDVDTSDDLKRVDIAIPHGLLDGSFSVLVNDEEKNLISGALRKNETHANFVLFSDSDYTNIEIVGTTVVPEFPINLLAITLIGIMGVLIALRFKNGISYHE